MAVQLLSGIFWIAGELQTFLSARFLLSSHALSISANEASIIPKYVLSLHILVVHG